jgi:hypothetical protein
MTTRASPESGKAAGMANSEVDRRPDAPNRVMFAYLTMIPNMSHFEHHTANTE